MVNKIGMSKRPTRATQGLFHLLKIDGTRPTKRQHFVIQLKRLSHQTQACPVVPIVKNQEPGIRRQERNHRRFQRGRAIPDNGKGFHLTRITD